MKMPRLRILGALAVATTVFAQTEKPLLLQSPTLSKTTIVFAYGGSLWRAART